MVKHLSPQRAKCLTAWGFLCVALSFTWMCYVSGDGLKSPYYGGSMMLLLAASVLVDWSVDRLSYIILAIPLLHIGLLVSASP